MPDALYDAIMSFRTDLVPNSTQCANYFDLLEPPLASWDPAHADAGTAASNFSSCAASADDSCCLAHRGHRPMSRVWHQTASMSTVSVASAFSQSEVVGTAVHQSEVAAVGDFNGDNRPDIVVGNRLFVNDAVPGTNGFAYLRGIQIGTRDFAQVYAGNVNGDGLDDVVAVYTDGSFEIFVTIHDHSKDSLAPTYIGFHSMGIKTELVGYTITTVNFIGTLYGYGTSCRGNLGAVDWGCTSSGERAVFVGTEVCKLLEFPDARHVPPVFPVRRTRTTTCGSRLTGTRTLQVCRT